MKKARQRAGIDRGIMLAKWRRAFDRLRGPPSAFQQLRELTERMHEGRDIRPPDAHSQKTQQQLLQKIEALEQAAAVQLKDWRAQGRRRAAAMGREHAALVNELRRRGVRAPITEAWEEVAKRYGHASGAAAYRWWRRNR